MFKKTDMLKELFFDTMAVIGVSLIGYGVYQIYIPASFIVIGSMLLFAAYKGFR